MVVLVVGGRGRLRVIENSIPDDSGFQQEGALLPMLLTDGILNPLASSECELSASPTEHLSVFASFSRSHLRPPWSPRIRPRAHRRISRVVLRLLSHRLFDVSQILSSYGTLAQTDRRTADLPPTT